jgi:hypothetical protein
MLTGHGAEVELRDRLPALGQEAAQPAGGVGEHHVVHRAAEPDLHLLHVGEVVAEPVGAAVGADRGGEQGRRGAVRARRDGVAHAGGRFAQRVERAQRVGGCIAERAHELDPGAFEVGFELAGRLAQAGKRERALKLLDALAVNRDGRLLRRVRGRQVYLAPGPRNAWRWIQTLAS